MPPRYSVLLGLALLATAAAPSQAQPGRLDPSFGSGGVAYGSPHSHGTDLALDRDKRIVFVGAQSAPKGGLVGRLLPDGRLDPDFNGSGTRVVSIGCSLPTGGATTFEAVDVQNDKQVVAAGASACDRAVVIRLLESGALDTGFGTGGTFQLPADPASQGSGFLGVDVGPDGSVTAVGWEARVEASGEVQTHLLVVRLTTQGQLDPSFGTGGVVRLHLASGTLPGSTAADVVVYPDGRALVAGFVYGLNGADTVVLRLAPDGSPDATFGTGGVALFDFGEGRDDRAAAVLYGPDGAIYLGGTMQKEKHGFFGARLRFDGTPDPGWGENGLRYVVPDEGEACYGLDAVLDAEDRLVLSGFCHTPSGRTWALTRLRADGVDPAFGVARPQVPGNTEGLAGIVRQADGGLLAAGYATPTGNTGVWTVARFSDAPATAAEPGSERGAFALMVAPSPARGSAEVRLTLETAGEVRLALYDALGRAVVRLAAGRRAAGPLALPLDVAGLPPGLYVLHVEAGGAAVARRVVVR